MAIKRQGKEAEVRGIGTIKNPLTIIAIFAGIVEVSSTTVLPFISEEVQKTYIWFLMVFPSLLVLSFFATLNWNNKALYAPSDFQTDDGYHRANKKSVALGNTVVADQEATGFL
ncbi:MULTISPECIES: hypothetical protein [unclassified Pseudomonas]|uniref:hypothetical protein n=1 Tax=unclassified Pseudomonas TaxID=196821 RepID=UPI000A1DBC85|nr:MULTISPECIES: hypothetical protein [unclassified Pseudomonas]